MVECQGLDSIYSISEGKVDELWIERCNEMDDFGFYGTDELILKKLTIKNSVFSQREAAYSRRNPEIEFVYQVKHDKPRPVKAVFFSASQPAFSVTDRLSNRLRIGVAFVENPNCQSGATLHLNRSRPAPKIAAVAIAAVSTLSIVGPIRSS